MMTYKTPWPYTIMRVAGSATSAMRKPQREKRVRNYDSRAPPPPSPPSLPPSPLSHPPPLPRTSSNSSAG
jgi:hypothetical protein